MVVIFLISLNHNGLFGWVKSSSQLWQADSTSGQLIKHRAKKQTDKLANSNNFNMEESILCRDFCVCVTLRAHYVHGRNRAGSF